MSSFYSCGYLGTLTIHIHEVILLYFVNDVLYNVRLRLCDRLLRIPTQILVRPHAVAGVCQCTRVGINNDIVSHCFSKSHSLMRFKYIHPSQYIFPHCYYISVEMPWILYMWNGIRPTQGERRAAMLVNVNPMAQLFDLLNCCVIPQAATTLYYIMLCSNLSRGCSPEFQSWQVLRWCFGGFLVFVSRVIAPGCLYCTSTQFQVLCLHVRRNSKLVL